MDGLPLGLLSKIVEVVFGMFGEVPSRVTNSDLFDSGPVDDGPVRSRNRTRDRQDISGNRLRGVRSHRHNSGSA